MPANAIYSFQSAQRPLIMASFSFIIIVVVVISITIVITTISNTTAIATTIINSKNRIISIGMITIVTTIVIATIR